MHAGIEFTEENIVSQSVGLGRLRLPSIDNISASLTIAEGSAFK
jgi:hypothetical protein